MLLHPLNKKLVNLWGLLQTSKVFNQIKFLTAKRAKEDAKVAIFN